MKQLIKKAIIPKKVLDTCMLPATKVIPKELLPVFDKPLILNVLKEAIDNRVTQVIPVTRNAR